MLDQLIEEAWEEESAMLDELIEEAWEDESAFLDVLNTGMGVLNTLRPAIHAAVMAWNSMFPEQKSHLIDQVKLQLKQLGALSPGAIQQAAMQAAGLIGRGQTTQQAVLQASRQVARQQQRKKQHPRAATGKPRPPKKRRSRRAKRFESWG